MVETAGLENRYARKGIEGSNPSLSVGVTLNRPRLAPIGFRDGLALCYILVAFAALAVVVFESLCGVLHCPQTAIPLPTLLAISLVIPFQRPLLALWHRHRRLMVAITLFCYAIFGIVLWAVRTGRLQF